MVDFRDVTAAKELEEAKDLFLATTSHELRTPITVVQGFASTLAQRWDKLTDAERRGAVQTIADRAGSLSHLVEQLLLGARAGADQLTVRNGPFDLAALLRGTVAAFLSLSDKHTLVAEIPDDLPPALRRRDGHRHHGRPVAGERVQVLAERRHDHRRAPARPGTGSRSPWTTRASASPRATTSGSSSGSSRARPATGAGSAASAWACTSSSSLRAQDGEVSATSRPGGGTRMRLQLRRAGAVPGPEP